MPLTKKIACPSCSIRLRVEDTLPEGEVIQCPKCSSDFAVPGEERPAPAARAEKVRTRKQVQPLDEDDDIDDEAEERPVSRTKTKFRKKKQAAGNTALVLGLVIGGVVLLGG